MEIHIQKVALEKYAKHLSGIMCQPFFLNDKTSVTGSEILKFCPVDQVNYFILKNLFLQWKNEYSKWKASPYFNYESEEVHAAMENLQRVLSNHIQVAKPEFLQLVTQAVTETLWLCYAPFQYFKEMYLSGNAAKVSYAELCEQAKYVKINHEFFEAFLQKLESYKIPVFVAEDVLGYYQQAYAEYMHKLQKPDTYLGYFEQLSAIPIEQIMPSKKKAETSLPSFQNPKPESELATSKSAMQPKRTIKVGLNQRIMFMKNLFNGDAEKLDVTIARLETAASWDNAKYILDFYKWDTENEVVQEFYELVETKFK